MAGLDPSNSTPPEVSWLHEPMVPANSACINTVTVDRIAAFWWYILVYYRLTWYLRISRIDSSTSSDRSFLSHALTFPSSYFALLLFLFPHFSHFSHFSLSFNPTFLPLSIYSSYSFAETSSTFYLSVLLLSLHRWLKLCVLLP